MAYLIMVFVGMGIGYFGAFLVRALTESDDNSKKKGTVLLSKNKEGQMVVEVDGKEAATVANLNDEQFVRVQNIALDFEKWVGRSPSLAPSIEKSPRPVEGPTAPSISLPPPILFTSGGTNPPPANTSVSSASSAAPIASRIPRSTPATGDTERPLKFSMNPMDMLHTVTDIDRGRNKGPVGTSIIAQVDAILQERVLGTPFEKSGLRLIEKPDHTMLIELGLNKYDGIDAIPSADVRDLIRSCVNEWTSRTAK